MANCGKVTENTYLVYVFFQIPSTGQPELNTGQSEWKLSKKNYDAKNVLFFFSCGKLWQCNEKSIYLRLLILFVIKKHNTGQSEQNNSPNQHTLIIGIEVDFVLF